MNPADDAELLRALRGIAERAGEAILEVYEAGFDVVQKEDRSPLTAADMAAHRLIVAALGELTPAIPVLSEESVAEHTDRRREWPRYWLVDPLDGTREFIKRNGEFSVNIALVEAHRSVVGVVHAPVAGYTCTGARAGARRHERDGSSRPLAVRVPCPSPVRVAGSRSHGDPRLHAVLDAIGPHELVPLGSALKFCLVAGGEADVYLRFGPTSEWDTAAGQALVEAAGGEVTDLALQPLRYNLRDTLINPDFIAVADTSAPWSRWLGQPGVA